MITTHEQSFVVHRYECDMHGNMLPSAILRRAQQLSTDHCDLHGLTDKMCAQTGTAFLLAKSLLEVHAPLTYNAEILMKTQAFAPQRAVYCRTISFYSKNELLAKTDGRWILIDTNEKRILRKAPPEIERFFPLQAPSLQPFGIEKAPTQQIKKVKASYTMCDINRHINNTVYADIMCNSLPTAVLENNHIKKLVLTYHNEVQYDACFELNMGILDTNGYYFTGVNNAVNHFEGNVYLENRAIL